MGAKSKLTAGLVIASVLSLGTVTTPAGAEERRDEHRGRDYGGDRGHDRGWDGGYYPAPPVIYGRPAYYPPPVVYGPAVGIILPGIGIGIR
jgi:hypothetical protein